MKWLLLVLCLITFAGAGELWVDSYMDCVHDTKSWESIPNSYYGYSRVGATFKHGDVFFSHYQYGLYGDRSLTTNFGLGVKRGWQIKTVFVEPFILVQRDFGLESNSIWTGFYARVPIIKWGE